MKSFLGGLLFLALASAVHASPFAGKYYAVSTNEYGETDGALNITVHGDGTLTARGLSTFDDPLVAHGNVKTNGTIIFKEKFDGTPYKHKTQFSADGQTFRLTAVGETIRGAKISASFPAAGVYRVTLDEGDEGVFVVYSDGGVYAHLNGTGGGYDLQGKVTGNMFSGTTANYQVGFSGTIDGDTLTGTYSDGLFLNGDFSAEKY